MAPSRAAVNTGAYGVGVLALLALGAYLIWKALGPLGDSAANASDAAQSVTAAVKDAAEDARRTTGGITETIADAFDPTRVGDLRTPTKQGVDRLTMIVVSTRNWETGSLWGGTRKHTYVKLKVTDSRRGAPVRNATVSGVLDFRVTAAFGNTGAHTIKGVTDLWGHVEFTWDTADVKFTAREDDRRFIATHPSYNDSNEVLVK